MYGDRYKKYDLSKIVRVKNNLIKTVNQPSCELSNKFANIVVREPHDSK